MLSSIWILEVSKRILFTDVSATFRYNKKIA